VQRVKEQSNSKDKSEIPEFFPFDSLCSLRVRMTNVRAILFQMESWGFEQDADSLRE